jgi:argininosuccinate lyase
MAPQLNNLSVSDYTCAHGRSAKILAGENLRVDRCHRSEIRRIISYDRRIYKQDIAGSIAHATMLAKVGLITDAERDAIIEGLKSIERDIEAGTFVFDEAMEDIHMVVEAALIKRIGEPGTEAAYGEEPE